MGTTYRLLLDENLEHEVLKRLVGAGHDVEHVDTVATLGKGASDTDLATYSRDTERAIVTYDDDFIEDVPPTEYHAALFFKDVTPRLRKSRRSSTICLSCTPSRKSSACRKSDGNGSDRRST